MKQVYSVSVEQKDGFRFGVGGCYTKDEVYSFLEECVNANKDDYDQIIEEGGVETDDAKIRIIATVVSEPEPETIDDLLYEFDKMTLALAKDGAIIKQEITPEQANLLHMGVGVSGEGV